MARVNKYVAEVEANASQMSSAGRTTYMYNLINAVYYGAKKAEQLTDDDKVIGDFRDEALKIQPNVSRLTKEDLK